jgi:hypothetical protein
MIIFVISPLLGDGVPVGHMLTQNLSDWRFKYTRSVGLSLYINVLL